MRYSEEKITAALLEEASPLMEETVKETGPLQGKFEVNKMVYIKMSSMGLYRAYIARTEEGKLAGFLGMVVSEHLYFPEFNMAQQDVLHLGKEHRKGFVGIKLLKYSEKKLKELGVNVILQNSTNKKDISKLFLRLGYSPSDQVFIKEI
jgi:L-amino acid N-acyltransferase YncA